MANDESNDLAPQYRYSPEHPPRSLDYLREHLRRHNLNQVVMLKYTRCNKHLSKTSNKILFQKGNHSRVLPLLYCVSCCFFDVE